MFSVRTRLLLERNFFDLMDVDNNIWIKEVGNKSVTISGKDRSIEVIFEDLDGCFDEYSSEDMNEVMNRSENFLNCKNMNDFE